MPNDQFARPVEIDWFAVAAVLKTLAEAESRKRPTLREYKDRYPLGDIPLLALDVEPHEVSDSESMGRWCLNYGSLDQFSGEFLQIALLVGSGLSFRPVNVDALTFLFHTLSLFLVTNQDLQQPGTKYLDLLMRPLPDGRVIQVRQILSLIKATELFARQCGIAANLDRQPIEVPESSALPWLLVQEDENLRSGFVGYPKWITQPDGRHRIVATREEHAGLFTEEWLNNGIVTTLPHADGPVNGAKGQGRLRSEGAIVRSRESGSTAGCTTPKQEGVAGVQQAIEGADRGGASWQGIEILFLSDERVQIRNGTNTETHNYAELGFADCRVRQGKPKPNQAWMTLRAMAELNGIVRDGAKTHTAWPKVEKRMQEIRKRLRKHFGITANPIPFVEGTGYQACFKIGCSPSFRT